jgi:hypothetical protein
MPPRQRPARLASKRFFNASIVVARRARLLAVCAMLSAPPASGAFAADPQIKPPIRGLVSMGAYRFVGQGGDPVNTLEPLDAKAGIFGGLVIIATWKQLQPTPASEIGDDNVIDRALADVRAYNARNPAKPLAVKLRVWGGFEAPDWAKQLGGAPIATEHNGKQRILGRFWSEGLQAGVVAIAGAASRQVRCAAADPGGRDHVVHVVHGRAVLPSDGADGGEPVARGGLHGRGASAMPGARRCRLRAVEGVAARALAESVLRLERSAPG